VTDEEYGRLIHLAEGQTLSEWVREVLLATLAPRPTEHVILAELLALRTMMLNLHFALATGDVPTEDAMKRLIERADGEKMRRALESLTTASARRTR
jgi:hypothetical protein